MNYSIGQFIGSLIAIMLMTALFRWILQRWLGGSILIVTTVMVAVLVASFLYAFGSADGGEPRFGEGLVQYGFSGVVVLIAWLFGAGRRRADG